MEIGKLTVQTRSKTGKEISHQLRMAGLVPGVCYGIGLEAPINVTVNPKSLKEALDPERRRNTVIDLTVEEDGVTKASLKALVWDYQEHALRRVVTHVDFRVIDPEKPMQADIPVELVGKPVGLIAGGLVSVARHSVTVLAKPDEVPTKFTVDIESLDVGGVIHVSDIVVPEGVSMVSAGGLAVCTMSTPRGEKVKAEGEGEAEEAT